MGNGITDPRRKKLRLNAEQVLALVNSTDKLTSMVSFCAMLFFLPANSSFEDRPRNC
jgi:hypothetical protein